MTCSLEFVQLALVHGVLADRSEGIANRGTIGRKGRGTTLENRLDDKAVTCLARQLAVLISPGRSPTFTDLVKGVFSPMDGFASKFSCPWGRFLATPKRAGSYRDRPIQPIGIFLPAGWFNLIPNSKVES